MTLISSRRRTLSRSSRDGFTLVELIVAIVILTVGLLASAGVVGSATYRQRRSTSRTEMMAVAENKLEHLRVIATSRSADTIQLKVGGSTTSPTTNYTEIFTTPSGKRYRTLWAVTGGPVGTRSVTMRVVPFTPTRGDLTQLDFTALFLILK